MTWDRPVTIERSAPPLEILSVERGGSSTETLSLRFQTAKDIADSTPESPDFIVPGLVAVGAITELDGKMKSSGKTTLLMWLVNAVLDGKTFLNSPTTRTPVVYLTEQTPATFREALRRADLLGREDMVILCWPDARGAAWPAIVAAAVRECHKRGARLLMIDTLPQFAGMRGDAENSAGAALQALEPLQQAAADGLAVVVTRHERKSGGEIGDSARGSSAFGGGVDIILQLQRAEGQGDPSIRILKGTGRYDETPAQVAIQLHEGVGYVVLGDQAAATTHLIHTAVLQVLPTDEASAMPLSDVVSAARGARTTVLAVLDGLMGAGIVERVGRGVRGDGFRYWQRLTAPPAGAEFVSAELRPLSPTESFSGHGDADEVVI